MKYVFFVILCLLLVQNADARWGRRYASVSASTSASLTAPTDDAPTYDLEKELLVAINSQRVRYGLVPLILDRSIHLTARRHCGWMANYRNMVHGNFGVAENIAMGQNSVPDVVNTWMNSSGHRANILNPGYRRTGLAAYRTPDNFRVDAIDI